MFKVMFYRKIILVAVCRNGLEWGKPGSRSAIWKPVMVAWGRDNDSLNSLVSVWREDLDSRENPCVFLPR